MSRRKVRDVMTSNVVSEADLLAKVEFADGPDEPRLFEGRRHRIARQKADGTVAGELMSAPVVRSAQKSRSGLDRRTFMSRP